MSTFKVRSRYGVFVWSLFLSILTTRLHLSTEELVIVDDHVVAPAHGLEVVDLAFEGIEMSLETKKGERRLLLDGSIRGRARPGRMLAIMGPSGKSTIS